MDILSNEQRVRNAIVLGESHFREFKTALEGRMDNKHPRRATLICRDIAEALVAFANADGGELLIGVEDDGTVTGLNHNETDINSMLNAANTHILNPQEFPLIKSEIVSIDGNQILMFSVAKSVQKIFQLTDGRCVRRRDKSTMPCLFEDLIFERKEQLSREYDREFLDSADISDLDIDLLKKVANEYMLGMSPEQYLQQLNLGEYVSSGMKLRRAAILLFAKDISRWEPNCQMRIVKVNGDKILSGNQYNVLIDDYVSGNIFQLLQSGWERLRPYLSQRVSFGEDSRFEQSYSYPESACREALINAIAHRDYATQNPITITFYNDRLDFESPGELLTGISIEALRKRKGVHESRNSYISRVLREGKFMREMGEGLNRIYQLMAEQELKEPELFSGQNIYRITLHHKSIYSQKEQSWLRIFQGYDLDIDQKRVVIAGMGKKELAPKDIYAALRSDDRNRYDKCVTALRVKGIFENIRSNSAATQMARAKNVNKSIIPRFRVVDPNESKNQEYKLNKVFVYNTPENCTEEELSQALSIFGVIRRVKLAHSRHNRKNGGYAFVEFERVESALKALAIRNIKLNENVLSIYKFKDNVIW